MPKSEDLAKAIAAAKLNLNTALLTGELTTELRALLRELQADKKKLDDASANAAVAQESVQRARLAAQAQDINAAAQTLQEARNARIADIAARFSVSRSIPDARSSSHA